MRKIPIEDWVVIDPAGKEEKENILIALDVLLSNKNPNEMPKGLENFRLFERISNAFRKADETKLLVLEEADYKFLRELIEKDIPFVWAKNSNIAKAVRVFIDAKEE